METITQEKKIVKAEVVNDFDFTKYRGEVSDHQAEVNIKVGNIVSKASVYRNTYNKKHETTVQVNDSSIRTACEAFGFEVDYSDVKAKFNAWLAPKVKAAWNKKKEMRRLQYRLHGWWVQVINNLKQIYVQASVNMTEDEFVLGELRGICVIATLNGYTERINLDYKGRFSWDGGYCLKVEKVADKVKAALISKKGTEEAKKELSDKKSNERTERSKKLAQALGYAVTIEVSKQWTNSYRRWSNYSYEVTNYYVQLGERKISVDLDMPIDGKDTYKVGSFEDLTIDQAKTILAVFKK